LSKSKEQRKEAIKMVSKPLCIPAKEAKGLTVFSIGMVSGVIE
jgi:hypothetical protein